MKNQKLEWEEAADVRDKIEELLQVLDLPHVSLKDIHCFRTTGSKSRAYARIWAMPKIFQRALNLTPSYVIEVLSKYYDRLTDEEKSKVLIHELLHIPKNFSGALVPHKTRSRLLGRQADVLFKEYQKLKQ